MAKQGGYRHRLVVRKGQGATGGGMLRRYTPAGAAQVRQPSSPQQMRELPLKGKAPKTTAAAQGQTTGHHTRGTSVTDEAIIAAVLAALAGGPLRLTIADIARQVLWEIERDQQAAMQQGGSYQRLGGF